MLKGGENEYAYEINFDELNKVDRKWLEAIQRH